MHRVLRIMQSQIQRPSSRCFGRCSSSTIAKPLTSRKSFISSAATLLTASVAPMEPVRSSATTPDAAPEAAALAALAAAQGSSLHDAVSCSLSHGTQVLTVTTDSVPAVCPLDAADVRAYLTSPTAPNLSPSSCPHLYNPQLPTACLKQLDPEHAKITSISYSAASICCSTSRAASSFNPTAPELPGGQQGQQQGQQLQLQQQQQQCQQDSQTALQLAAHLLRSGQPVAIPTETVYGLAANALSPAAVAAVFAAKGRPSDNPLIVHISDLDMLAQLYPQQHPEQQQDTSNSNSSSSNNNNNSSSSLSFIPAQYRRLIAAFWPGPLTLLLPASPLISSAVTAGLPTVAVRMPAHPVARALIAAAGVPLAAPSANTSGRPSPTSAQHVLQDLAGKVAAVVDGGSCECGVESTVLDGLRSPPVVLRPGGITPEVLGLAPEMAGLQVYQRDFVDSALEAQPTTPGMKYRHYSPSAPLLLLDPSQAWQQQQQQQQGSMQQHQHSSLQQLVVVATEKLLHEVQQQQQQPQNQLSVSSSRIVLLSTCSRDHNNSSSTINASNSSRAVGWTTASLHALQSSHTQQAVPSDCLNDSLHTLPAGDGPSHCSSSNTSRGFSAQQVSTSEASGQAVQVLEYVLGSWQEPELVAQSVFAALRVADAVQPSLIVVQGLPPEGAGLAVMNRLQKAASRRVHIE